MDNRFLFSNGGDISVKTRVIHMLTGKTTRWIKLAEAHHLIGKYLCMWVEDTIWPKYNKKYLYFPKCMEIAENVSSIISLPTCILVSSTNTTVGNVYISSQWHTSYRLQLQSVGLYTVFRKNHPLMFSIINPAFICCFLTCVSITAHVIDIGWTSVRHTLVLCQNGSTCRQTAFTAW